MISVQQTLDGSSGYDIDDENTEEGDNG